MTYTRIRPINLYDAPWTEAELASVVGQEPGVTLDGSIAPGGNPTAVIQEAAYEGGLLILDVSLPEGITADDLGGGSPHDVTLGYVHSADGIVRVHTIGKYDQVPETPPDPTPPGYVVADTEDTEAPGVVPSGEDG